MRVIPWLQDIRARRALSLSLLLLFLIVLRSSWCIGNEVVSLVGIHSSSLHHIGIVRHHVLLHVRVASVSEGRVISIDEIRIRSPLLLLHRSSSIRLVLRVHYPCGSIGP